MAAAINTPASIASRLACHPVSSARLLSPSASMAFDVKPPVTRTRTRTPRSRRSSHYWKSSDLQRRFPHRLFRNCTATASGKLGRALTQLRDRAQQHLHDGILACLGKRTRGKRNVAMALRAQHHSHISPGHRVCSTRLSRSSVKILRGHEIQLLLDAARCPRLHMTHPHMTTPTAYSYPNPTRRTYPRPCDEHTR
jgi:hypothetical protein